MRVQDDRWDVSSRRVRTWIDVHDALRDPQAERRDLLRERRRRDPGVGEVLVAVPGAGHAAVEHATLAERPALMPAHARQRGELPVPAEDGDALPRDARGPGAALGNLLHGTESHPIVLRGDL